MKRIAILVLTITLFAGMHSVAVAITNGDTLQQPVESILLDQEAFSLVVNESATINAVVLPEDATSKMIRWQSSDEFVARVINGKVTALHPGSCTISALSTDGNEIVATCEVVVIEDGAFGEFNCKYIQSLGWRSYRDLNTRATKALYAVLAYYDVLEYLEVTGNLPYKQGLIHIVQQAAINGRIYINAGNSGYPINVLFVDDNGKGILISGFPSIGMAMYSFHGDTYSNGVLKSPQRIDTDEFCHLLEMDLLSILQ